MKVTVDDSCTACGLCVQKCPEVFDLGEQEGVATVLVETVPLEAEGSCREAAENCPVEAIHLEE
jgi:ferredoxin